MKKIWEFIRQIFGWSKPTKPSQVPPPPKPVRHGGEGDGAGVTKPIQSSSPPEPVEPQQPIVEGGTVPGNRSEPTKLFSTSASNTLPTKHNTDIVTASNGEIESSQHTENKNKNSTADSTESTDKDKKSTKEPPKIDGRRNGAPPKPKPTQPKPKFVPKPELICQEKAGRVFDVILSVPTHYKAQRVEQNGTPIQPMPDNEYTIADLSQPIILQADEITAKFPLFYKEKYMIFKTRNNWEGIGRYVKNLTRGYFTVITPSHWHQESPSVEHAWCSDKKYLVHFFRIDPDDKPENIKFFKECQIPPIQQKIFLKGKTVQDDSKRGELFVNKPPTLNLKSGSEIAWIRIGEEGRKKTKSWSCDFKPAEKKLDDVLDRYGHFFLRAYNKDIQLIDSTEFRYYGDLSKIQIDGESYNPKQPLPPPQDGYEATKLEFIGTNDQLLKEGQIDPSEKGKTVWTLKSESGKGKVKVVINLPRIRWQLSPVDNDQWSDQPIIMTRKRFQRLAHSGIKLKLHVPRYIKRVTMGFNEYLNQTILTKEGISLTTFVDYKEIDLPQSNPSHLQFAWNDIMVTAITIHADKPQIKPAPDTKPSPDTCNPKLRPTVTGNRGLSRQGKGFSTGELELANINITRNVSNIYYIDYRRRTVHQKNVDTLKGFTDATSR